jgi:hypothetical protein
MNKINELTKPLPLEEIELRIGSVSPQKGFSLLAYKNSRVDVKRFNEVFGTRWYPKYHYDNKGLLVCTIYVYDDEIEQWIGREDVGVESYTEKEKGSYSDALKRAGFRWGVGIELYAMPFIWIAWDNWKEYKGKSKPVVYLDSWQLKKSDKGYYIEDGKGNIKWQQSGGYIAKSKPKQKPKPKSQTANNMPDNKKYASQEDDSGEVAEMKEKLSEKINSMFELGMLDQNKRKSFDSKIDKIDNIALLKYVDLQLETIVILFDNKDKFSNDEKKSIYSRIFKANTKNLKEIQKEITNE